MTIEVPRLAKMLERPMGGCGPCSGGACGTSACPAMAALAKMEGLTAKPVTVASVRELLTSRGGLRDGNFVFSTRTVTARSIPWGNFAAPEKCCSQCNKNPCQCEGLKVGSY